MRTFKHFPKDSICLMCGKNTDTECTLILVDGTGDGKISEAIPVHADCIRKGDLQFNREANIFYQVAEKDDKS